MRGGERGHGAGMTAGRGEEEEGSSSEMRRIEATGEEERDSSWEEMCGSSTSEDD